MNPNREVTARSLQRAVPCQGQPRLLQTSRRPEMAPPLPTVSCLSTPAPHTGHTVPVRSPGLGGAAPKASFAPRSRLIGALQWLGRLSSQPQRQAGTAADPCLREPIVTGPCRRQRPQEDLGLGSRKGGKPREPRPAAKEKGPTSLVSGGREPRALRERRPYGPRRSVENHTP
jgi:hypothetical protein